ncbi:LysR family transcriptional regulator [Herbaspirillum robiniae]|uniref:LysR family transcriptional regulator n=1 Tax=Herbaspirillum robiniae TaxID=2014887 RepID=A0ABX2LZP6_9BURK|nr:LysR family transcriptional regulator [Herbaspirillum robiniae]NUU00821.1 LysR family transcriptional regulator [Herbaspirillum robiniae]
MSDRLFSLRVFVRIARSGSFSKAGRELGLSQPSISRIAAELEKEIGAALFTRTTRAVTLTEAGSDYLARIEPILAALEEADHAVRGTGELRGKLRVALTSSLAAREVVPLLPAFMERHPALKVEMMLNDQMQDLVQDGADLALRFGALPDSSATARRLGISQRMLLAAPAYLGRHGTPQTPADLSGHSVIVGPTGVRTWQFVRNGRNASVRVDSRVQASTNEVAVASAVAGLGIVQTSYWGCRDELERGALVRVLPDWDGGSVELHAVFPAGHAAKPAARSFAEHLFAAFAAQAH